MTATLHWTAKNNRKHVLLHLLNQKFSTTGPFVCPLCAKKILLKEKHAAESYEKPSGKPKVQYNGSFVCPLCAKQFLSKKAQQNHIKYQAYVKT
jgi:uncharacterized Zn finger protein (UPF0148 family)